MLWGDAAAKIAYLLVIPTYAMGVLVFMGLKIAPALIRILRDFDLDLPGPTVLVFDASEAVAQYWFLGMPLYAIVCYLLVHAVLRYIGVMVDVDLPGMGFVKRRYHAAVILDIFALATQHGRPIREAIGILASRYPCWLIRSKLGCVWRDADQGMDWVESLFHAGWWVRQNMGCSRRRSGWATFPGPYGKWPQASAAGSPIAFRPPCTLCFPW